MCNFLLAMAMQFQEIIALPSHVQIFVCSMSCAGSATSFEKLQKYWKLFIAPCSRFAIFPHDSNAVISENYIAIVGEKLLV